MPYVSDFSCPSLSLKEFHALAKKCLDLSLDPWFVFSDSAQDLRWYIRLNQGVNFSLNVDQNCSTSSVVAFFSKSAWDDFSSLLMDW